MPRMPPSPLQPTFAMPRGSMTTPHINNGAFILVVNSIGAITYQSIRWHPGILTTRAPSYQVFVIWERPTLRGGRRKKVRTAPVSRSCLETSAQAAWLSAQALGSSAGSNHRALVEAFSVGYGWRWLKHLARAFGLWDLAPRRLSTRGP